MHYLNFNGDLLPEGTAVFEASSSAVKFGDGVFETIKFANGNIILLKEHLDRLWKGLIKLQINIPTDFTYKFIEEQIKILVHKNNIHYGRIRLSLFRENNKTSNSEIPNYVIESWSIEHIPNGLNTKGYSLGLYTEGKKIIDDFSNLKHNNYLTYLMAAKFAKEKGLDDALVLNQKSEICESSIANIFIVSNGEISTVALSEGCVEGTIRNFIITNAFNWGYSIIEKNITIDDLLNADEIFLTNAIINIRWVEKFADKTYTNSVTKDLLQQLEINFPAIFC